MCVPVYETTEVAGASTAGAHKGDYLPVDKAGKSTLWGFMA
jgi:hypothetical protein